MTKLQTTVEVKTVKTLKLKPLLTRKLRVEIKAYKAAQATYKTAKATRDKVLANIGALREEAGEKSFLFEGVRLTKVEGTSSKLDKKKLVELGCALAWIEEATVVTPKKAFEKVTLPGEKEEEF